MSLKIALERIRKAKESNATSLDLSDLGLTEIPLDISILTQLSELNLRSNQITEIKGLNKLTQLSELNLNNNKITEIKGLENLTQLSTLNLNNNKVSEIKGLENLNQLSTLRLFSNNITEIKGLENLNQLSTLNLENNNITEIKGLENLNQLSELYLSKNQIADINGLEKLNQLSVLYLNNNQITKVPENILELKLQIKWKVDHENESIFLKGNPLTRPTPGIIQQGNKAIQEYFKQSKKSGAAPLNEAKLILLGDGRSGKTSFSNRLLGKELPQEADRTQGVDIVIGEYSFPMANGQDFKLNIWDFAGQDKYKTLHQLFYTESSLYIMVAESGNMTTDYDDWFQTAALFGEGSPLILVLNEFKTGIGMGSFDVIHYKKQFPELLKEVFTVNLGTKDKFKTAEDYLQFLAQTLPHTKHPFPSNWAAVRKVLNERRDEQFITIKEYLKICKDNGLPERESALILSSVLHKIGSCLHYQKSDLLKQFIILKNEWATEAVYKVLDDEEVAEKKCGFFDLNDLERIWCGEEFIDMRPQLLELMKQFKLAYQLPGKDEYITPPLLPPGRPQDFEWPGKDSLELYIEYEFLPKALLTQFIVDRHADIAKGRTLVWRHGVILKWNDKALAEVSKTKLQGRDAIYIRTQGTNRKEMMTVILNAFRELHSQYKGIKYEEKVPCPCEDCKQGDNKQHYFDFSYLKLRREKGRRTVECERSLNELNLLELLENTFVFEQFKDERILILKQNISKENPDGIRLLKLFLASSYELKGERDKIEQAIGRKNKRLRPQGFSIELLIWEDGKHIGKSLRSQDNYNLEVEQCDLFVLLFYSKVGKYSLEEFKLAKSKFEQNDKPRLLIFQKDANLPKGQSKEDSYSRFAFLEKLEELKNFPSLFQNEDMLINKLQSDIDKLLHDKSFVDRLTFE